MNNNELTTLQNLPLDVKIMKTIARIIDAVTMYGVDGLYVSYSGGKDSKVLNELVKIALKELDLPTHSIPRVFCDTGLEWDSVRESGIKAEVVIKPKMNFVDVIKKYGYPAPSKEQAQYIRQYRTCKSEKTKHTRLHGNKWGRGKISTKWLPLIRADYMVSEQCCDVMKKRPFKIYEKKTGRVPIIGVMAEESQLRRKNYLRTGCNAFELDRPYSIPIGFWREQDVLRYIKEFNVEIPEIYGEVMEIDLFGTLVLTGEPRTGCVFCMFGCTLDNYEKFDNLKKKDPKKYNYCMRGGSMQDGLWKPDNGLGMGKIIKELKKMNKN